MITPSDAHSTHLMARAPKRPDGLRLFFLSAAAAVQSRVAKLAESHHYRNHRLSAPPCLADPFGTTTFTNPWFGVDLGTPGNQLSHVVVKTASWIDSGGSWSANYPVSIHVGDSQDWSENEPCVQGVTDFGTAASLVSLDGASSLEPIKRQEVDGDYTGRPDLPASVIRFSCSAAGR